MINFYDCADKICSLIEEIKNYKFEKEELEKSEGKTLEGMTREESLTYYKGTLINLLDQIATLNNNIISELKVEVSEKNTSEINTKINAAKQENLEIPNKNNVKETKRLTGSIILSKKLKKEYIKELDIKKEDIKSFIESKKKVRKTEPEKVKYTVYHENFYGKLSNLFFKDFSFFLNKSYPEAFKKLNQDLKVSGINVMSKTYVSIILFSGLSSFILSFFLFLILLGDNIVIKIIKSFGYSFLVCIFIVAIAYLYPSSVSSDRKRKIKRDLPFAIIHMSAIAGSGSHPINIFKLLIESKEYKGLESELKKILNYTNLFGYSLTSALRGVAKTTPSPEFQELLSGMVSTLETGGDLKEYLKSKSDDALRNYSLERKKYVETLATYSDIYTGVLIAAPLLFVVVLAIIDVIGGQVGGVSASVISTIGVYGLLPLLNIAFLVFLTFMQPE